VSKKQQTGLDIVSKKQQTGLDIASKNEKQTSHDIFETQIKCRS
jgi:hypothetical protein